MSPVERLEAIEAIHVLKADYFLHTDHQRWDELAALFAPGAETDFREATGQYDPSLLMHDPAAFAANNARVLAGVTTMHIGSMPRIVFEDDDHASAVWSMEDWLWIPAGGVLPAGAMHGWGHYHDRYVRRDGAWKIAATRLTRTRLDFAAA
ncbi:MAG TPA: nuclear transport factor 2 family protein [Sphingomonas sp.]|nr:nuclear transport factor 2 family protein [Sphingomonas sp.]